MPRPCVALLAAATVATLLAGCLAGDDPSPRLKLPPADSLPRSATSKVVVIAMENKSYSDVVESGEAPYFTSLARRYAAPSRLFAITHPSLPNYIALLAGDTVGIDSNCTSCHVDAPSLPIQLERAGRSWRAYMQGMPRPCFRGARYGRYAKKHNPFVYFDQVIDDPARCARVVPYPRLARDLRGGRLADFTWITPDLCSDTHDCGVRTGDDYLKGIVPALLRALGPHGLLVVTWDEGTDDAGCCGVARGGRIATLLAGPDVRSGATGAGPYTHYSILRLLEDAFELPYLRHAAAARPLDELLRVEPRGLARRR